MRQENDGRRGALKLTLAIVRPYAYTDQAGASPVRLIVRLAMRAPVSSMFH